RGRDEWQRRLGRCLDILRHRPAVFLQGPPGCGKSFITQDVAKALGATVYGPLNLGGATRRADTLGSHAMEESGVRFHDGEIARWARDRSVGIKLLIIDEANLTAEGHWRYLLGLLEPEPFLLIDGERVPLDAGHKIIFTGNDDTMAGRHFHAAMRALAVTLRFRDYSAAFLESVILEPQVRDIAPTWSAAQRTAAMGAALTVHGGIRRMFPEVVLSSRNLEECMMRTARALETDPGLHVAAAAAQAALTVYAGALPPEVAPVLRLWVRAHTGVCALPLGATPQTWVRRVLASRPRLLPIPDAPAFLGQVADFLDMRGWRAARPKQRYGQVAMLIEGPPGQGETEAVLRLLQASGLVPGDTPEAAGQQKYYVVSAGHDFSELVSTLNVGQREGAVVVVKDIKQIGSGLAEGQLNALLSGATAHPAFAMLATSTAEDAPALSDALLNRFVRVRLDRCNDAELRAAMLAEDGGCRPRDVEHAFAYHRSLAALATAHGLAHRPTPADALTVVRALADTTRDVEDLLTEHYALYRAASEGLSAPDPGIEGPSPALEALAGFMWLDRDQRPPRLTFSRTAGTSGTYLPGTHTLSLPRAASPEQQRLSIVLQAGVSALTLPEGACIQPLQPIFRAWAERVAATLFPHLSAELQQLLPSGADLERRLSALLVRAAPVDIFAAFGALLLQDPPVAGMALAAPPTLAAQAAYLMGRQAFPILQVLRAQAPATRTAAGLQQVAQAAGRLFAQLSALAAPLLMGGSYPASALHRGMGTHARYKQTGPHLHRADPYAPALIESGLSADKVPPPVPGRWTPQDGAQRVYLREVVVSRY
ncbi:MAG TPA: AAA family ATPase, partial [Myxococcota bacterium]|nr:AAA family ATPase [Myxococcota bacterium]